MPDNNTTRAGRWSPIGAATAVIGAVLLAYGVTGLIFGGSDFGTDPGGTVNGETWLGLEGNGWTNLLFAGAGGLLILGSPTKVGALTFDAVVGVALGAAAIIALFDGDDVLGVVAANGWTVVAWAVAAIVLLLATVKPASRSGSEDRTVAGPPRDVDGTEREALERELLGPRGRSR